LRKRWLSMARSFETDATLLTISQSVINESKRLLATLEELASATSGDEARHEPTAIPIRATSAGIRTLREANRSALSVHSPLHRGRPLSIRQMCANPSGVGRPAPRRASFRY